MKGFNLQGIIFILFYSFGALAQVPAHTVTLHFKYGSRPAPGQSNTENKWFGGIHGGHVLLQIDTQLFSFYPTPERFHIFPHKTQKHGEYIVENLSNWAEDTPTCKMTSIIIPITQDQYTKLLDIKARYRNESPYDYAFFGMRCAAAAYDILGQIGVVKKLGDFSNVLTNFYPQPLRQKMLRYAIKNHLTIIRHQGRKTRVWEKDFVMIS